MEERRLHPGLIAWEVQCGAHWNDLRRGHLWQVIRAERAQLAFDHRRTCGKCRFGAGEVVFTGDREGALAFVNEHEPDAAVSSWPIYPPPPGPYVPRPAFGADRPMGTAEQEIAYHRKRLGWD